MPFPSLGVICCATNVEILWKFIGKLKEIYKKSIRTFLITVILWSLGFTLILLSREDILSNLSLFFSKAALVTFGGAYALLPYVFQNIIENHGWLTSQQMIDGLALGESTPGPLIMIVT